MLAPLGRSRSWSGRSTSNDTGDGCRGRRVAKMLMKSTVRKRGYKPAKKIEPIPRREFSGQPTMMKSAVTPAPPPRAAIAEIDGKQRYRRKKPRK